MFTTLKAKIKTMLDTLKGVNKPFVEIFDYHTISTVWFPYVSFEPTTFQADILDNCSNIRTYNFDIVIYQEISVEGRKDSLDIVVRSIEDIIDLFDKNYTLDGTAQWWVQPVSCDFFTITEGSGKIMGARVTLACKVIQSIR